MIVNGVKVLSPAHLETLITEMDDNSKNSMRNFYQVELLDTASKINSKIKYFQSVAPSLLTELYVANTMAGITTAQSDAMFDDYEDVLTRIREGAFPTAYYRLCQKTPQGFVTQPLIDEWKAKVMRYLV
jgi:hypothetical protein